MIKKIFMIEDSLFCIEQVKPHFDAENIEYQIYPDTTNFEQRIKSFNPDIIILDYQLDETTGDVLCKQIREFFSGPIVIYSALHMNGPEGKCLEAGADDFITKNKPFKTVVLPRLKRHVNIWRKFQKLGQAHPLSDDLPEPVTEYVCGSFRYDVSLGTFFHKTKPLSFSDAEHAILKTIILNSPNPTPLDDLFKTLNRNNAGNSQNNLMMISRLRKKMTKLGLPKDTLVNIRSKGYVIDIEKLMSN